MPPPPPTTELDITPGKLIGTEQGVIVLALFGTDYQLHLCVEDEISIARDRPVKGRIYARARRMDLMASGGRFIEPAYGRPRRIQGTIAAVNLQANTITVACAGASMFICELGAKQSTSEFPYGGLVGFDVERGARFELVG